MNRGVVGGGSGGQLAEVVGVEMGGVGIDWLKWGWCRVGWSGEVG